MVALLLYLKKHCPWLWRAVEAVNEQLFRVTCPSVRAAAEDVLGGYDGGAFSYSLLYSNDVDELAAFMARQPEETLTYFRPHAFDIRTLTRLQRNRAYVMMKVTRKSDGQLVGYFFLRCFFIGRAFHGLIVDGSVRGQGIGTSMWMLSSHICRRAGLSMFATISSHNLPSLDSCRRGTEVTVKEHLKDGFLLVECRQKK